MGRIMKVAPKYEDMHWMRDLAAMIQVSIVGYMVAGAFLELAKFDLLYALVGIGVAMNTLLYKREMQENAVDVKDAKHKIMPAMTMETMKTVLLY